MTIQQIYNLALQLGLKTDLRGEKGVKKYLAKIKKYYESLSAEEKKYFDETKLQDPYADSSIHLADSPKLEVRSVLAGIDIDVGEVLLAANLQERGEKIDLILGHHPIGKSYAELSEVMDLLVDSFVEVGVPVHVAENLIHDRMIEVSRGVHPINHYQAIDAAKLLKVNLMNTHTLTDNLVQKFIKDFLKKKAPETVGETLKALMEIPEYQIAKHQGAGPKITSGRPENRLGKFMIEMTGGTNPSEKIYQEVSKAGISTVISMHMNDKGFNEARGSFLNLIFAGHMASDSLGMNLFLDELEKKGIKILPCSGLIRVSRVKK
ncbi:MAG: NIF3 (NGG1p interacting factor 3)-like protein [Candidatus Magasanikbacteria bacterium GW2011_GWC2_40_17]|uniref:NIF3 (NGG1p interacting factor 3)-like protein n=1 Tax=Candidatus Magasanikbacteria bacterium GW2011_GWA2_42_32 TaxID=1619039 RepID=A0A0G1CFE2_9BACT|nr:MAG: NIF3 (NGG1p interacting factor 3)-like protein [Candidatus Magasanikbacteria bacterium GW2011_GWC2_40_17]KKS57296.1 MAG: NIF3 (NGG1p interacting factor 3)-like protein [Candidatus Magasanikbacteria bacterium GW2011_GWA2_42_32]OGH85781.1 MAG: NGG1p interacting factor NIF3 [Candidatus Magasanikbacteria bacterium RIFOXYB2_FULL_38_10]